jgi:hypothetical protein
MNHAVGHFGRRSPSCESVQHALAEEMHLLGEAMGRLNDQRAAERFEVQSGIAIGDTEGRKRRIEISERGMEAADEHAGRARLLGRLQGLEAGSTEMGHQSPTAEFAERAREFAVDVRNQSSAGDSMRGEMSRDRLDIVVDLGCEDVADALQNILDILRTKVKALVQKPTLEHSNFDRTVERRESAANDLRKDLGIIPVGPGRRRILSFVGCLIEHAGSVELSRIDFEVQGTWDGKPLEANEFARIGMRVDHESAALVLTVDAAFYDDPAPETEPGSVDGLWEFEVVEIFLLGDDERYLEIELGPHGHFLGLCLAGRRNVIEAGIPVDFSVDRRDHRWRGEARISLKWLPSAIRAANAYAIHGLGNARRYLAAHPVPGDAPDFHRLECFAPLVLGK